MRRRSCLFPRFLALPLVVISLSAIPALADSGDLLLLDADTDVPAGWTTLAWGGMSADVLYSTAEAPILRITPKDEDAQAWSGAFWRCSEGASGIISANGNDLSQKFLNFQINGGRDLAKNPYGGQNVQAQLTFITADGQKVTGSYVLLKPFLEGENIDDNPLTWQQVSIPLSAFKVSPKKWTEIRGITSLAVQFCSSIPPRSGVDLREIEIGSKSLLKAPEPPKLEAVDPRAFPKFEDLKPPILLPPDPVVTVDQYGNYVVAGKPRFLLGAQISEVFYRESLVPTSGYPPELKWLYEEPLDYKNAQRLGFDTVGYFASPDWLRDIDTSGSLLTGPDEKGYLDQWIQNAHLPLYVDFTLFPWLQGAYAQSKRIAPEAKNSSGCESENNHWVPYALLNPKGQEIYRAMFEAGAKQVVANKGHALFYELFNEPGYDDPSDYNRQEFVKELVRKYGTLEKLNATWGSHYSSFDDIAHFKSRSDQPGLFVDWCKFMEDAFVTVCRQGEETIRKIDPGARFCVQVAGGDGYRVLPKANVNLYKLSQILDVTSAQTAGGIESPGAGGLTKAPGHSIEAPSIGNQFEGMLHRRFLLSISRGKPIGDDEGYVGRKGPVDWLWLEVVRGGSAAYAFEWNKRAWDPAWGPQHDAAGGRKVAEAFSWMLLNPYGVATANLACFMDFKRELMKVDDLFVPRQNTAPADVALLLSYPTERYSQAMGGLAHHLIRNYAAALEFSHCPWDIVLEEQLPAGALDRYKVLVLAGVSNIYPGTYALLKSFVEKGGTLILGAEVPVQDEYGQPIDPAGFLDLSLHDPDNGAPSSLTSSAGQAADLPGAIQAKPYREFEPGPGWTALASLNGKPAFLRKDLGKGAVYYIGARLDDYSVASLLGPIFKKEGVRPSAEILREDNGELEVNLEAHRVHSGDLSGFFLYNWDRYPKLVRFSSPETGAKETAMVDPLSGRNIPLTSGQALLSIPPAGKRIVVVGPQASVQKRFGALPVFSAEDARAEVAHWASTQATPAEQKQTVFPIDENKVAMLDLKAVVNRDFVDGVAGDGKGGWTDQGENSLSGVEWGRQVYCGIPFEIIRPDMNGGKAVVSLQSMHNPAGVPGVRGIQVGGKVKTLYFLHCSAWTDPGADIFSYVVRYSDGTTAVIPIHGGNEVGDWWIKNSVNLHTEASLAWQNGESRGFFVYPWKNPEPDKPVDSLEIVSSQKSGIGLVIAITAELN